MMITVLRDVMVAMRDGVTLATDIYLPGDGRFSVLLERTPYGKRGTNHADRTARDATLLSRPEVAQSFAQAGFAYVLQDCRGRYGSGGEFKKYLNEGEDGVDTLAWIAQQPWCGGPVGTLGLSYGAHVQAALASFGPAQLGAMFLDSGGFSSAFHSGIRQGGAFELKQVTWASKHARLAAATAADPARRAALEAADLRQWIGTTPWRRGHSPLAAAPEYEQFVLEQWHHETFDDFWKQPGLYARGYYQCFPDVPMVHMSSWFDPYALTATENFSALSRSKRSPVRLLMGPWTHGQRSVTYAGQVDFGPDATLDGSIAPDYNALRRAWFDRHLRLLNAPDYLAAPVTLFVMGGGTGRKNAHGRLAHGGHWRRAQDWPLPGTRPTPYYLQADGALSPQLPLAGEASLDYDFDPRNPVPTIGGAIASGAPLMVAGAFDQVEGDDVFGASAHDVPLAERDDVLVFQTEPLAQDVEVTGPVNVKLWVSSSARDTDFTVKLLDVYPPSEDYPSGCAINLTHGILRMRFRDAFERPALMEPNAVYQIDIQAFPTSNLFAAGHRIRLDVSSSNFPHFDVNPNTGAPAGVASEPVVARNRIHLDRDHPSHIVLPLQP